MSETVITHQVRQIVKISSQRFSSLYDCPFHIEVNDGQKLVFMRRLPWNISYIWLFVIGFLTAVVECGSSYYVCFSQCFNLTSVRLHTYEALIIFGVGYLGTVMWVGYLVFYQHPELDLAFNQLILIEQEGKYIKQQNLIQFTF